MSIPLVDLRAKVTPEADAVLEAAHKATGRDKSEIVRDVLHKWAVGEIHAATVLQQILQREGLSGAHEGRAREMTHSRYWPGTNLPKSQGNAFDWANTPSGVDLHSLRKKAGTPPPGGGFGTNTWTMKGLSAKADAIAARRPSGLVMADQASHGGAYSRAGTAGGMAKNKRSS